MAESGRFLKLQMAKLLAGCLFFARGAEGEWIPVNRRILDVAIKSARKKGAFPPWVKENLHFADSRVGIVCVELDELLHQMYQCCLLEYDSTFRRARFLVTERVVLSLLKEVGVGKKKAKKWGRFLRKELEAERRLMSEEFGGS